MTNKGIITMVRYVPSVIRSSTGYNFFYFILFFNLFLKPRPCHLHIASSHGESHSLSMTYISKDDVTMKYSKAKGEKKYAEQCCLFRPEEL